MLLVCILNFRVWNALVSCIRTAHLHPPFSQVFITHIFTCDWYITNHKNYLLKMTTKLFAHGDSAACTGKHSSCILYFIWDNSPGAGASRMASPGVAVASPGITEMSEDGRVSLSPLLSQLSSEASLFPRTLLSQRYLDFFMMPAF